MQEIITTGKTVDEAIDEGCAQLGLSRDDVTYEILEMPQKKLFGSKPAQVKVTALETFSIKDLLSDKKPEPEKKPEQKPEQKQRPATEQRPEKKPDNRQKPESRPSEAPKTEKPAREPIVFEEEKFEAIGLDELTENAQLALNFLKEITELMGATRLTWGAGKTERGIRLTADGEDASLIIGRRGETMDALQHLATLTGSRTEGDYSKVSLDVANYRSKREGTLVALAKREAEKVKKNRYNRTLEPMNPYERRIVHSAVQLIEGVKSESVGSEPNRRVVISLESGGRTRERNDRDRRGGGYRKDDRPRKPWNENKAPREADRPAETKPAEAKPQEQKPAVEKKTEDAGATLYGKIEF